MALTLATDYVSHGFVTHFTNDLASVLPMYMLVSVPKLTPDITVEL